MSIHLVSSRGAARVAVLLLALSTAQPLSAQQGDTVRLTLPQAIELAQQQGYRAQAAAATREAARYEHNAFRAGLLPRLTLGAGGSQPAYAYNHRIIEVLQPDGSTLFRPQDQTSTGLTASLSQILPLTGGQLFVSSSLQRLSVSGPQDIRTWSSTPVSFGLIQPLLRPNTSGWDRREQSVSAELAERAYRETREDIAVQTSGLFLDAYAAQVELAAAIGNAAVNDTLYTLNKGRFEIGKIVENDLLQSQLALLRARTRLDAARLERERTLAQLRLALHLPPGTPIDIVIPADVPVIDPDTAVAVRQALANRPVVTSMQLQDVQARRRVTEAKLNNWLNATLNASYGFNATASEVSQAYQNLLEARTFSLSVSIPLVQWGAHGESVQAAEANRAAVESNTQAALDQTALDARFAALALSQARRNLALSATGDTVGVKRFEVAYNRYLIGKVSVDALYIAQQEKDQARSQYLQALRGYWQAYYTLRRVTLYDFERGEEIR